MIFYKYLGLLHVQFVISLIVGEELEYLLAFFNSRIFNKFVLECANTTGGKGVDFLGKVKVIRPLPHEMDSMKNVLSSAERDLKINEFFYKLYGLTNEEIMIAETK